MPRSRNTRIRPKNTSRSEARRRHRDEQRSAEIEPNTLSDQVDPDGTAEDAQPQSAFSVGLPDVRADLRALPGVFKTPIVWAPFGLILAGFFVAIVAVQGSLTGGDVGNLAVLFMQLTFDPTSLIVYFIAGFVAPRASYLVGAITGVFMATLYTIFLQILPSLADESLLNTSAVAALETTGTILTGDTLLLIWAPAVLMGTFAAGFAAWYRRFLRNSQARARANREIRDQEKAKQAKEQARADKQAAREARRNRSV